MKKTQIDRKEYFIIKYAYLIIFFVSALVLVTLYMIKIDDNSLLNNVMDYYLKKAH